MSLLIAWEKAQGPIKNTIGESAYDKWFANVQIKQKDETTLIIEAPDEFFKDRFIENYSKLIDQSLLTVHHFQIKIHYDVNTEMVAAVSAVTNIQKEKKRLDHSSETKAVVNHRFSFENFVVGSSNRFAHAAAMAVAESPAKAYNPLFIYGGVGLGKTHLMQAITYKIQETNPNLNYCFVSSERFTNELIDAIRNKSTTPFRQKYRNIDVLLIDDIHFIAGKESTQEEFFHTFNTLHDNRKQIIISSDRSPKEIAHLEERLISRFAWGLIADIQPPDFETRVAILRKKLEYEKTPVPNDVLMFIGNEIKTNIRELEGALIRVIASSLLEEKPVSLAMAQNVLKDLVKESTLIINVDIIQQKVVEFFKITLEDLKMKRRNKNIVLPRQVAMYLSRKLTNLSLPEIGQQFGGKDHTTVLHSCKKIEQDLNTDKNLKNTIEKLITTINMNSYKN